MDEEVEKEGRSNPGGDCKEGKGDVRAGTGEVGKQVRLWWRPTHVVRKLRTTARSDWSSMAAITLGVSQRAVDRL